MKVRAAMSRGIDTYTYFYLLEHSRLRTLTLPKKEVLKAYKTSFFLSSLRTLCEGRWFEADRANYFKPPNMPKMAIDISLCSPLCNWYLSFSPFFTKLHNIPRVIVIDLLYHWSRVANKYVCGFAVLRFVRSYMREIINYHVMDRINLFRNNIVIMYEPELEHEFCDAMTINTPTQLRVYIKKGVNNNFF